MERLDVLVAGLGVLVVATAMVGVATSPRIAGEGDFTIGFVEQRTALPAQQGAIAGDGQTDVPLQVQVRNLTRLEVTVRVAGAGPRAAPDAVTVTLTAPDGRAEQQQLQLPGPGPAAYATATFERDLGTAPPARVVAGADEAAALAAAAADSSTNNGTGTWTVRVAITGGTPLAQVHNEGHTIVVEAAAVGYRAVVQPETANPR
jgi:hypothetical protein